MWLAMVTKYTTCRKKSDARVFVFIWFVGTCSHFKHMYQINWKSTTGIMTNLRQGLSWQEW